MDCLQPSSAIDSSAIGDAQILELLAIEEAREQFWAFRRMINPKMKCGWWQRVCSQELQQFYYQLANGQRPKLVLEAPPQHGKSTMVVELLAWVLGRNPDLKCFYTSFSERLGIRANKAMQRILSSPKYHLIFPDTTIGAEGIPAGAPGAAIRNQDLIEMVGRLGYFRNTTVRGSITGEGLDLGVVDDPIKGREDANSDMVRDKTWDWLTDDFMSRFSDDAGFLSILTRWHVDDPIGRLRLQLGDAVRVVSYPAIAVCNEDHRKVGEALFPEHKSLAFLLERKAVMASVNWEALYQQNPQIIGGELIRGEWFGRYKVPPIIKWRSIYADTAQKTKERHDYSVFQCWGMGSDGKVYLLDQIRGKWEAPELKRKTVDFWAKHSALDRNKWGQLRRLNVEDAASGTGLIQELHRPPWRIPINGVTRTKDKYTRMLDVLGYIESGYVLLPDGAPFVSDFVTEAESFTSDDSHLHDDQMDPMIDAINEMLATRDVVTLWERQI